MSSLICIAYDIIYYENTTYDIILTTILYYMLHMVEIGNYT